MFSNPFRKMDMDRKKRSSGVLRQMQEHEKVINRRVKVTISVVCVLFTMIVARLMSLQIINQKEYSEKLINYTAQRQSFASPRGTIYDSKGNILVESVNSFSIIYYPNTNTNSTDEWKLAERLVDELDVKATSITERQLKELHVAYKKEMLNDNSMSTLSKKELKQYEEGKYSIDKLYEIKIKRADVSKLDDRTKAIYQVKMKMNAGYNNQYKVVCEDVNPEQIAYLEENSSQFPGFRIKFDWKRNYSDAGKNLKGVLGNISTQMQGIPGESSDYYLALDYGINERVGISGLEKQYESFLAGTKSVYDIEIDESGNAVLEEVQSGKSGYDLHLSIDADYQKKMDDMLKKSVESLHGKPFREYYTDVYLVVMDVKTGAIRAISGATYDKESKTVYSNPTGTYMNQYRAGSVVKLATLYMGLNEGVVTPGEVIMDAPMHFRGTQPFHSFKNYGPINDIQAIAHSSNVYMGHIAIRLAGGRYIENGGLPVQPDTFTKMRTYYNMFGLGVKTGIDLPSEAIGAIGNDSEVGKILYYAIGQYDTYTAMQLAQYAATLANDGKRVQPHLLDRVSEVNDSTSTIYKFATNIVSSIIGDVSLLKRGEQGMVECITSGFCGRLLAKDNVGYQMAAKSGTAEDIVDEKDVTNASMIAYGPVDNPEIAISCIAPSSNTGVGNNVQENVCNNIVATAAKEYFANK